MIALEWLRQASASLRGSGIETARLDAIILLEYITKTSREDWLAQLDRSIKWRSYHRLQKALKQRERHYPLAYITGYKEFFGLKFRVNNDVLIPRPETEKLVEIAIKHAPKKAKVLDVGTGSGCIAVALAHSRPDLDITASDISQKALRVAAQNAAHNGVSINFVRSNLLTRIPNRYKIIIANLPYVPDASKTSPETAFEPFNALFGGKDGLDLYRTFLTQVTDSVLPGAILIIEADPKQHAKLKKIAETKGLIPLVSRGFALVCRAGHRK